MAEVTFVQARNFKNLICWKKSMEIVNKMKILAKRLVEYRDYSLKNQIV